MFTLPYEYGTNMAAVAPLCLAAAPQQVRPFTVFSVQFATELTSRAAPRTVLQAATARAAPINANAVNFWIMMLSYPSQITDLGNATLPERLHRAGVILADRAAE
jgi:hypothetical protein